MSGGARLRRRRRARGTRRGRRWRRRAKNATSSSPSGAATRASWRPRRCARGARLVIAWGGDGTINEVGVGAASAADVPLGDRPVRIRQRPGARAGRRRSSRQRAIAEALAARRGRSMPASSAAGCSSTSPASGSTRTSPPASIAAPARAASRPTSRVIGARDVHLPAGDVPDRLRRPGEPWRSGRRALLVTIANSPQFGNGARIAPSARLDDGLLDLVVFEEASRFGDDLRDAAAVHGRRRAGARRVDAADRARTIESDAPMTFHVDGEPVEGGTTLEVRVLPRALTRGDRT